MHTQLDLLPTFPAWSTSGALTPSQVMDALQKLGALKPRSAADTEPLKERAKGHKECRTRDEALELFGAS